ncbi:hypothetical protein H4R35_003405 [Dimargaris xerosporica]|nr:hypothetical protein H4R35_003405 [Dimargaris xerosporica]
MLALICALLLSVGGHYAAHTLSALKATVKEDFGISNTQYGIVQSAVSLVNTVLPVLGGLFIDAFGTSTGSVLATSCITLGTAVVALSTHSRSYAVMVCGRLLYGLGSGTIVTVQETILSHWFTGKGLAVTIALQIATARLASFLSMGTTIPIAKATGFYGCAFWASAAICFCSWLINLLYVSLMRHLDQQMTGAELSKLRRKNTFRLRHVLILPTVYWLVVTQSFVLGSGWTTFLHISSELVKLRFHLEDEWAAWYASVSQFLPVFLVPFLGLLIDRRGHRVTALLIAGILFVVSVLLLGFTQLFPVLGMFIFSISLSIGPIAAVSSIPLTLPLSTVGSGLGIFKSAQNIGNTIVDIIIGQLQDLGQGDPSLVHPLSTASELSSMTLGSPKRNHGYDRVMVFFLGWGCVSIFVSGLLYLVDRRGWDRLLQLGDKQRLRWIKRHANIFCHYQTTGPNASPDTTNLLPPSPPPSPQSKPAFPSASSSDWALRGNRFDDTPTTEQRLQTVVDIEECLGRRCDQCPECNRAHVASAYSAYAGPIMAQSHQSQNAVLPHSWRSFATLFDPHSQEEVSGQLQRHRERKRDRKRKLASRRISLMMDGTSIICSSSACSKAVCSPGKCHDSCAMARPGIAMTKSSLQQPSVDADDGTNTPTVASPLLAMVETEHAASDADHRSPQRTETDQVRELLAAPAHYSEANITPFIPTAWHYLPLGIYALLLVTSWVLFGLYLL